MKYNFKSDYLEICSPEILEEIAKINLIQRDGYQEDSYSAEVRELIKSKLGNDSVDIHFMVGGTITNLTFIAHTLRSYEAVIAAASGHIATHETGAIEQTGHKICIAEDIDGKLYVDAIKKVLAEHVNCHMVKPKLVFISNSTEYGTIYSKQELKELYEFCQSEGLYLYLDGARLAHALEASDNDLTLNDVTTYTDAFYIGATKNGAMLGEALVIKNDTLKDYFRYQIKSRGGLLAKGSLIAAQFKVMIEKDLFAKNARHANAMAKIIKESLISNNFEVIYKNNTNQVFVKMDKVLYNKLANEYGVTLFAEDNEGVVVRFVTAFMTDEKEVIALTKFIESL